MSKTTATPQQDLTSRTVTLDEPITRGDTKITQVVVRKPGAGELRGVSLSALGDMDVTALHRVLPRVTSPMLNQQDVENLAPADLLQFGVAVASFLLTTAQRREAFPS
jgi:hypothetical protein